MQSDAFRGTAAFATTVERPRPHGHLRCFERDTTGKVREAGSGAPYTAPRRATEATFEYGPSSRYPRLAMGFLRLRTFRRRRAPSRRSAIMWTFEVPSAPSLRCPRYDTSISGPGVPELPTAPSKGSATTGFATSESSHYWQIAARRYRSASAKSSTSGCQLGIPMHRRSPLPSALGRRPMGSGLRFDVPARGSLMSRLLDSRPRTTHGQRRSSASFADRLISCRDGRTWLGIAETCERARPSPSATTSALEQLPRPSVGHDRRAYARAMSRHEVGPLIRYPRPEVRTSPKSHSPRRMMRQNRHLIHVGWLTRAYLERVLGAIRHLDQRAVARKPIRTVLDHEAV